MLRRRNAGLNSNELPEPCKFDELASVFRIVTLYEILLHEEWKYVKVFRKLRKTELSKSVLIGASIETVKFLCICVILVLLLLTHSIVLDSFRVDGNVYGMIATAGYITIFYEIISAFAIIIFMIQVICYQLHSPSKIALCYSFNFLFSCILSTIIIFYVVFNTNQRTIFLEGFQKNVLVHQQLDKFFDVFQKRYQCCGIEGAEDYLNPFLYSFKHPITGKDVDVRNEKLWVVKDDGIYSIPRGCCINSPDCSFKPISPSDRGTIYEMYANQEYDAIRQYQVLPLNGTYFETGCLDSIISSFETFHMIMFWTCFIFIFFTALSTAFVIILLLYQDGVGHLVTDDKMFDVSRNTGVYFLEMLEKRSDDFEDNFSLIEFLRNTDIDKMLAEGLPKMKKTPV